MGKSIPSSIRGIRVIRGSILLLGFVLCSFQFSSSAKETTTSSSSVDGITSYDTDDESVQVCENSSDPWNDLDETASVANDKAVIPSRQDQHPLHFAGSGFEAITLRLLPAILVRVIPLDRWSTT